MSSNQRPGLFFYTMPEETFAAWRELTDFLCSHPSCTGLSNHALLICRKPGGDR